MSNVEGAQPARAIMDTALYISFILASIVLIIMPGPNVLVIASTSISYGNKRGLQTVLGTASAMALQLLIAALGTTWLVDSLSAGFEWLRWFGIGYLMYLGVSHLYKMTAEPEKQHDEISAASSYQRGFFVSLTNPKTILFFGAFLPQYVTDEVLYLQQITLLSVTFLVLATVLDSLFAILANHLRDHIRRLKLFRLRHGLSGVLFIGAGAWLALLRRG